MAEVQTFKSEVREERLKQYEQNAKRKQEQKRLKPMQNHGFSSGGRPQSAAGGRRSRAQRPSPTVTSSENSKPAAPNKEVTIGNTNHAFDESDNELEVEEVITNIPDRKQKSPEVKKVAVTSDYSNETIELVEEKEESKNIEISTQEIENNLEEVQLDEKPKTPEKKNKKKKRKPKPEKAGNDVTNKPPSPILRREDTVLFPGDEYYQTEKDDLPEDSSNYHELTESFVPVGPDEEEPDFRPLSRISIQTTAGSAGIEDIDGFVFQPAPQDDIIKCRITRDRKGIDNRAYPVYYLHMEREGMKKVFLLGAKKRKKTATSSYIISTDPTNVSKNTDACVAKLRSNMMGTRFTCYDSGKAYSEPGALIDPDKLRKEMVTIGYETNVLGFKGPRRMTVVVPGMDLDGDRVECQPTNDKGTLSAKLDSKNHENITILNNKSPVWNEDSQSYVLNFHGRVTQASVKNFQIVHEKEPDYIVLQFGRVEDDVFTMDYKYPLCAIQAFSIALSSFDNKLACE